MMPVTRRIRVCVTFVLLGLLSSALADDYWLTPRRESNPDFQYHPSPQDWRDINMYQLFTDRFNDGNPGNNNSRGWYTTDGYRHYAMGGDWKGVKDKLGYLQGMGVNCIWISGVQMNKQGVDTRYAPYHAYHPSDFYRCEPMFGTFAELKDLIDTAHSMGIYVVLDVVINHMADRTGLGGGKDDYYHSFGGGDLFWWDNNNRHAWPFDGLQYFHNNGKILNWGDYWQTINGAFVGTDDLRTEDPYVQGHLTDIFKNLIEATDCDGFRVDAIKHVEYDFMMGWADTMRKHAAWLGKTNFILFGENFTYDDGAVAVHCKDYDYAFNSALYFPMQLTMKEVFAYEQATRKLTDRRNNLHLYGEGQNNLVAFMDNHDVNRIALEMGGAWGDKLGPALTFLYTATPVPCLFYGTEHGFNQGGTWNNGLEDGDYQRECMFNYGYQPGNAWGDKFYASGHYNYIKTLNELRAAYKSLTRGDFTVRWENSGGKGIYAYTRAYNNEESLVVFNTDWGTQSCQPAVGKPDGTVYVNMLNPAESLTVSGGKLNVSVDGKQSKIFVAGASFAVQTECGPDVLTITYDPAGGPLEGAAGVHIGIGYDGFQGHTGGPMTLVEGKYEFVYAHSNAQTEIEFYFHDGQEPRTYDNNNGQNWGVLVAGCGVSGEALTWVGGTYHWPQENIAANDAIWVNTHSEPLNAGGAAAIVFSTDGGNTWESRAMTHAGTTENNHDWWNINLGTFPAGTTIRYATMVAGAQNTLWDNNGGNDHQLQVGESTSSLQWIGNTYHWPTNGAITSADDLWINIEAYPIGGAVSGKVVYSSDGGANWSLAELNPNGTNTQNDLWHVNLGTFAPNATIRYALVLFDADGGESWDNNNGNDYLAQVEGGGSSIVWHGNVEGRGAPQPWAMIEAEIDTHARIGAENIKDGTRFAVIRSPNLRDWAAVTSFVATAATPSTPVELVGGPGAYFYGLRVDEAPVGAVQADEVVMVHIDSKPVGSAIGATVVYSADGGANWQAVPMSHAGVHGDADRWMASLGSHPGGTVIQYAIELEDVHEATVWNNNSSADYFLTVGEP